MVSRLFKALPLLHRGNPVQTVVLPGLEYAWRGRDGVTKCEGGDSRTDFYTAKGDSLREQSGQHSHWVALSGVHTGNATWKVLSTKSGMVAHVSNPSMQEVDAGPGLQGHSQLYSELEASLGYPRPYPTRYIGSGTWNQAISSFRPNKGLALLAAGDKKQKTSHNSVKIPNVKQATPHLVAALPCLALYSGLRRNVTTWILALCSCCCGDGSNRTWVVFFFFSF